jgi:hypothetical protein
MLDMYYMYLILYPRPMVGLQYVRYALCCLDRHCTFLHYNLRLIRNLSNHSGGRLHVLQIGSPTLQIIQAIHEMKHARYATLSSETFYCFDFWFIHHVFNVFTIQVRKYRTFPVICVTSMWIYISSL